MTNPSRLAAWAAILLAALALRAWGLDWSLPNELHYNSYHGGESRAVAIALDLDLGALELEPRWKGEPFFRWGSHYLYAVHAANLAAAALGAIDLPAAGEVYANATFGRAHLIARAVSVAYALATVVVLAALASRAYGRRAALWTGFWVAVCPLLAYQARFATVNSCLTFWCALAVALQARAAWRATWPAALIAGLALGLACAVKLSALPLVFTQALALALASEAAAPGGRARALLGSGLASAAGALAGFAAAMPFALVRPRAFWAQLADEYLHSQEGHGLVFAGTGNGFAHFFGANLPVALGWPLALLALCGAAWAARELWRSARLGSRRSASFAADALGLAWLAVGASMLGLSETRFLRYLMPFAPFFCLFAARLAAQLAHASRRPRARALALALALCAGLWTAAYSAASVRPFAALDPRDACAAWLFENVPSGATLGLVKRPYNFTPPIYPEAAGPLGAPAGTPAYAVAVLGADAARLAELEPEWVLLNPVELFDELRLAARAPREAGDGALAELGLDAAEIRAVRSGAAFDALLRERYRLVQSWQNRAELLGVDFDWSTPPQGWAAPVQRIELWQRAAGG